MLTGIHEIIPSWEGMDHRIPDRIYSAHLHLDVGTSCFCPFCKSFAKFIRILQVNRELLFPLLTLLFFREHIAVIARHRSLWRDRSFFRRNQAAP